jgi:hypothetical protein
MWFYVTMCNYVVEYFFKECDIKYVHLLKCLNKGIISPISFKLSMLLVQNK